MTVTLSDVVGVLEGLYPPSTAQSWDQVGLVCGEPTRPVERVLLAVDPTLSVIAEARQTQTDLLVTHHPLLLRGIHSVATTSAKGASITDLIVSDTALYVAHTNADVAATGVCEALAAAAGLVEKMPLTMSEDQPLGRVGTLASPMRLADFATSLYAALPPSPVGLRVAGPADATVEKIAVLGGAGDGEFDAVRGCGADVYVTADLRHHPALEAREEAGSGPPYLIDAGHWSSEAVWLPVLRDALVGALKVEVTISSTCTDPWAFTVGARGPTTTGPQDSTSAGPQAYVAPEPGARPDLSDGRDENTLRGH